MNRLSFEIKLHHQSCRILDQILSGLHKTLSYFDDITVHGLTKEKCRKNIYNCLQSTCQFDLHLNRKKQSIFQERIEYLGHIIEYNMFSKSPDKVVAILDVPKPKTVEELRRFLRLITVAVLFRMNRQ